MEKVFYDDFTTVWLNEKVTPRWNDKGQENHNCFETTGWEVKTNYPDF